MRKRAAISGARSAATATRAAQSVCRYATAVRSVHSAAAACCHGVVLPVGSAASKFATYVDWLAGWLAGWLTSWLADWLTG